MSHMNKTRPPASGLSCLSQRPREAYPASRFSAAVYSIASSRQPAPAARTSPPWSRVVKRHPPLLCSPLKAWQSVAQVEPIYPVFCWRSNVPCGSSSRILPCSTGRRTQMLPQIFAGLQIECRSDKLTISRGRNKFWVSIACRVPGYPEPKQCQNDSLGASAKHPQVSSHQPYVLYLLKRHEKMDAIFIEPVVQQADDVTVKDPFERPCLRTFNRSRWTVVCLPPDEMVNTLSMAASTTLSSQPLVCLYLH